MWYAYSIETLRGRKMQKDTSKIIEELGLCDDFKTFYDENREYMINDTLSQLLKKLVEEKKLSKSQVIKESELSEVYAYQIFSGLRTPDRKKLLSLAVGMHLNLDEVQTLLKTAGYPTLYVKHPFDSVVIYGICKKLTVIEINGLLFNYNLDTLG